MTPIPAPSAVPVLFPPVRRGGKPGDPRARDWEAVLAWLEAGRGFLLTTHVNPDADGLGSLAALAHVLEGRGRSVCVALPSPPPEFCRFLLEGLRGPVRERPEQLRDEDLAGVDRVVILDVSSRDRVGGVAQVVESRGWPVLVLDHHQSNSMDDPLVVVHPGLSSTGELVGALLAAWGEPVTEPVARCLFAALHSDTGGFSFASTGADTLELAAALVRGGAHPARVHEELNQNHPAARFDLLARFLSSRRSHADGRLATFELGLADLAACGARREDSEGFVNLGLAMRGCVLSVLLFEQEGGQLKVNLRCVEPLDVCGLAVSLGGGGHRLAAGATVAGTLDEWRPRVLQGALALLESN
jgi:phosphoesterase RecJ-like protein